MCVCVCEREREREREVPQYILILFMIHYSVFQEYMLFEEYIK